MPRDFLPCFGSRVCRSSLWIVLAVLLGLFWAANGLPARGQETLRQLDSQTFHDVVEEDLTNASKPPADGWSGGPTADSDTHGQTGDASASVLLPADCNGNGIPDEEDIASGTSRDCNATGIPDECEIRARQLGKLMADDASRDDVFGSVVAVSGDTIVVGARLNDHACPEDDTDCNSGSAYVYQSLDGAWQQVAKLVSNDLAPRDSFGVSVSVSRGTIMVGASGADTERGSNAGAVYVFREVAGVWTQVEKLAPEDAAANAGFGRAVCIKARTAIVGAPGANGGDGAAYIFQEFDGLWRQTARLTVDDTWVEAEFASSVAVDGDTAVVGAFFDTVDGRIRKGSAYVFRELDGAWRQVAKVTDSSKQLTRYFGYAVAVRGDTVLIGAPLAEDYRTGRGAAFFFREVDGVWTQIAKVRAPDSDGLESFGYSVSLNGLAALIGAPTDSYVAIFSGAAYLFREGEDRAWRPVTKFKASDAGRPDYFGSAVSLSGDLAVVGAYQDGDEGPYTGSAYAFDLSTVVADCDGNRIPDECELLDSDCNANGILDMCDLGSRASNDCNLNRIPDECDGLGDLDGSGRVDLFDYAVITACLSGPRLSYSSWATCCLGDFDADWHIDLADVAEFQRRIETAP